MVDEVHCLREGNYFFLVSAVLQCFVFCAERLGVIKLEDGRNATIINGQWEHALGHNEVGIYQVHILDGKAAGSGEGVELGADGCKILALLLQMLFEALHQLGFYHRVGHVHRFLLGVGHHVG